MSLENVETVQAAFEAWNTGDMDALRDLCDPDLIVRGFEDSLEGQELTVGREPVMRGFGRMRETWDADAAEAITDFIDAGDRVVVRFIWRGTGHGPAFGLEVTAVYTLRKGKVFLVEYFRDHAEALEAVGLSEQDAHTDS
jgi:ketosteroid isomerase-like protein